MLNYAIIGFGGLGKMHFSNYEKTREIAGDIKLVALCDIEENAFVTKTDTNLGSDNSSLDLSAYNLYNDVDELLSNEKLDFVITALPTYIHEKIAVKVMEKGINVFSEKPMALNIEQAQNMIDKAKENNVKLMIGQCVRFWPAYVKLKEMIVSGEYGKVIRAHFTRQSGTPIWSWQNWYMDESKSGGAALDLHVHDTDFINYVFGMPQKVNSVATNYKSKHDSIVTTYDYGDMVVTSTGEWGCSSTTYEFTTGFFVKMEKATIEIRNGKFMLYPEEGEKTEIEVPKGSAYINEIVEFIDCIRNDRKSEINPPEESLNTLKIALAEKRSADLKQTVTVN